MPSNPPSFINFRDSELKRLIERRYPKASPHRIAKAILRHVLINESLNHCPICGKDFESCQYFESLENE